MKRLSKYSMGATAAIITSMGLIAGIAHGKGTKPSLIAGLLIIALADNVADSLGIHIYKESENCDKREILDSTYGNFITRLILVFTFIFIVFSLPANLILMASSAWGLILLVYLSYGIAKAKGTAMTKEIFWHVFVALAVLFGSKLLGNVITQAFIH